MKNYIYNYYKIFQILDKYNLIYINNFPFYQNIYISGIFEYLYGSF